MKGQTAIFFAGLLLTAGCSAPDASRLTHPPRLFSFPMYVTVPGTTLGSGSIQKIDAPSNVDGAAPVTEVIGGLDFPAAIAVDASGNIYYTERPTPTTGRIMRLNAGETVPEELATNLADPQGLALDRADRLYVTEMGKNTLSRYVDKDTLEPVLESLAGPRSITADENDNLYVTELSSGTVSRVIPDGTREELAKDLSRPYMAGPGLVGNTFVITNAGGVADGQALQLQDSGGTASYLDHLINPKSFGWEDGTILYVAEGAPAFRIIKYSRVTKIRVDIATLPADPHTLALTPVN